MIKDQWKIARCLQAEVVYFTTGGIVDVQLATGPCLRHVQLGRGAVAHLRLFFAEYLVIDTNPARPHMEIGDEHPGESPARFATVHLIAVHSRLA